MRIIGWIREGDQAACGGTVAEGDGHRISWGKACAFEGARMDCPGDCVIAEGYAHSRLANGRKQVVHGMKTSGGCPLLSTLNDRDGVGTSRGEPVPIRFVRDETGAWTGKMNEGYDQQFVLTDEETGRALVHRSYRMTCNGKTIEGQTDADGKTHAVASDDPSTVTIEGMPEGWTGGAR